MKTKTEILKALRNTTFNVYMRVNAASTTIYRVVGARECEGALQVQVLNSEVRRFWPVTPEMVIYIN